MRWQTNDKGFRNDDRGKVMLKCLKQIWDQLFVVKLSVFLATLCAPASSQSCTKLQKWIRIQNQQNYFSSHQNTI